MPEGPDDAVQDGVEVIFLQGEERSEVELDQCLQEAEEVSPDFREGVEIRGNKRE